MNTETLETKILRKNIKLWFRFLFTTLTGAAFFLLPLPLGNESTVPFDLIIKVLRQSSLGGAKIYTLFITLSAIFLTFVADFKIKKIDSFAAHFKTGIIWKIIRSGGGVLAVIFFFNVGPQFLLQHSVKNLMFNTLATSVALIVPVGAVFVALLIAFGGLDFMGTLARPFMRPLFKVPGRASLDAVASFVGSYSVGLYVTNRVYLDGMYTEKEAAIIATSFSTVSFGFFGVVASTLGLMDHFPHIVFATGVTCIVCAIIVPRIPPIGLKPDRYCTRPNPEKKYKGRLLSHAIDKALEQCNKNPSLIKELYGSFIDGLRLAMLIVPAILFVGTAGILLARYTPVFKWLSYPFIPIMRIVDLQNPALAAKAAVVELAEMFLPSLVVVQASAGLKFFVAVLSLSQIIFFSATIPLMLSMELPLSLWELLSVFVLRTLIATPIAALFSHIFFS